MGKDPMPNTSLLFGPLLIGVFFNTILYGVCAVQALIYYRTYKRDATWIRFFVLYLFLLETVNTAFDIAMMYEPLVLNFGEPKATLIAPKMLVADPCVTALISTSVQFFISWRIRIISNSLVMPAIIAFLGMCAFAGGIALSVCVALEPEFARFHHFDPAIITWLAASALADLLITGTLAWSLIKRKTEVRTTDDRVSQIIRLTVHTGLLTATLALADVIVFVALPQTTLNFIWDLPLSKIYTNALLSTLNARGGWNGSKATSLSSAVAFDSNNVLFGCTDVSSWRVHTRSIETGTHFTIDMGETIELGSTPSRQTMKQGRPGQGISIITVVEQTSDTDNIRVDYKPSVIQII